MTVTFDSGRTAIVRTTMSRPVRLAREDAIINEGDTVLDFGCGHGGDVERLQSDSIDAVGWDPNHAPDGSQRRSDVVNLGYVLNVIDDPAERMQVLTAAWTKATRTLVVSARLAEEQRSLTKGRRHADGWVTGNDTFQKFYSQSELRSLIDATLDAEAVAAAPGVFYVFREETGAQAFMSRRRRRQRRHISDPRRLLHPRESKRTVLWEKHEDALAPLLEFYTDRGRLPRDSDPFDLSTIPDELGTTKQAWQVVTHATDPDDWAAIASERRHELLLDLALGRLNRRSNFTGLPIEMQNDVREFYSNYTVACDTADALLASAGDPDVLREAAAEAPVGKVLPTAIYVHASALPTLPFVLRAYEGAARWLLGDLPDATIVKLATHKPKISYLSYPGFDKDPHPRLTRSITVHLGRLDYRVRSFVDSTNPPILHRKELFVDEDYPERDKFARLTAQEERYDLYRFPKTIGTVDGWRQTMEAEGVDLRGHRVIKVGE